MFTFDKKEVGKLFSGKAIPLKNKKGNKLKFAIRSFVLVIFVFAVFSFSMAFYSLGSLQASIVEGDSSGAQRATLGIENLADTFTQLTGITLGNNDVLEKDGEGWTSVLLLGMPSEDYPGQALTDSILIASMNPEQGKLLTISVPRDLAVQNNGKTIKINSLFHRNGGDVDGSKALIKKLEEVTGIEIHYYVRLDFVGFEKFVDSLGGIDVDVTEDIYDPQYPTLGYGTEVFEISKGKHHLDGTSALKYVRTRHTSENDFGRSKRQQQVLKIVVAETKKQGGIFNWGLNKEWFNLIKDHVRTNITLVELKSFYELSRDLDTSKIQTVVIDNRESGLLESGSSSGLGYYLKEKGDSYEQIHEYISSKRE